jgi:6-phosphofructokinase 1
MVQGAEEENRGSSPSDPVLVMQAMGRRIGFIPAAARLADPERQMPLLIFLAESGLSLPDLADSVNDMLKERGRALVVISEGFDVGELGEARDAFGHVEFSASQNTVAQVVVNYLNEVGLAARGDARFNVTGTHQRHDMASASTVDVEEAYAVGRKAALLAAARQSGYMATILRKTGPIYGVDYDKVPLKLVANSERAFPEDWIAPSRTDVTDDFIAYAKPLLGKDWLDVPLVDGRQRFARLESLFARQVLPDYVPQAYRQE